MLRLLGRGGMGAVLLGRQVSLDRKVALKVMRQEVADDPTLVARFAREAYAAAQLTHHNVVQVYDIGEDTGTHFFSMEYVAGSSLLDLIREEGRLAPETAVGYVLQAARGLRQGHNQGMVHRDIKPGNLLLNADGVVKVADLGLVKLGTGDEPRAGAGGGPSAPPDLTGFGTAVGTPAFMAPEQSTDSAGVDQRADVYSLGCTLYALLTGRPPFEGRTALEVITKHRTQPVTLPEAVVKRVPPVLAEILQKMTAKHPAARYQSMDEVIAALEGFLGVQSVQAFNPKEEQADRLEALARRYNAASRAGRKVLLALLFVVACAVGLVGFAAAGDAGRAVKIAALLLLAPAGYFVAHGVLGGGVVAQRLLALVCGMRVTDWVLAAAVAGLLLLALAMLGAVKPALVIGTVSFLLGVVLWFQTDGPERDQQREPLRGAQDLIRSMRVCGLDEEAIQRFACRFAGPDWEPLFEALFGYEAKLAARTYRAGHTGEAWRKAGTWREPIVEWADGKLEVRRQAREQRHLYRLEAKALAAQGVDRSEADARAAAVAADMVGRAASARQARREGKAVDFRELVAAARDRRPRPGYNIAGVRLRNLLDEWFGGRLRLAAGAALVAAGLLWMHQNGLAGPDNPVYSRARAGEVLPALEQLPEPIGRPVAAPGLPPALAGAVDSHRVPLTGLMLVLSAALFAVWRASAAALPGAAFALYGPRLGLPAEGPLTPGWLSLLVAAVLILVAGRFLRR